MGKFKIFRSSAGSGKTYTLTREYIKLALASPGLGEEPVKDDYFRRILAITFTHAAAAEMKERILKALDEMSLLPLHSPALQNLLSEIDAEYPGSIESEKELKERCWAVLRAILHNYSDFSVSTIDAFVSRLVQGFKRELKLPYHYEIELETADALEAAVAELLAIPGTDADAEGRLCKWLIQFLENQVEEGKSWDLKHALTRTAKILFDEDKSQMMNLIKDLGIEGFVRLEGQVKKLLNQLKTPITELAKKALDLIRENGLSESDFNSGFIYNYFIEHSKFLVEKMINKPSNKFLEQLEAGDFSKKANYPHKALVKQISHELINSYQEIEYLKKKNLGIYILIEELNKHIYQLALLDAISDRLDIRNQYHERIQLPKLYQKIHKIVESEPVPFIYERLGERYYHIMIDEFQDTSLLQWQNLLVLVSNALSYQTVSLVVGDAKQAIYRWRGGKASMLVELPDIPYTENRQKAENAQIFHREANQMILEYNFRSYPAIVEFNNSFFGYIKQFYGHHYPQLKNYYQSLEQKITKSYAETGQVIVRCSQDHIGEGCRVVMEWLASGVLRSDIAILCNTNRQAIELSVALIDKGIPVITADSLLVAQSPSVQLLVHLLKVIDNPKDGKNRAQFLFGLKTYRNLPCNDDEISFLAKRSTIYSLFEFLNTHLGGFNERKLAFLSLLQKIIELIRLLKLPFSPGEQPFLQKFLDFALEYTEKGYDSLTGFLEEFEAKSGQLSINLSEGVDAVRIMTIHKSKGLQFPYVLLPFAYWELDDSQEEIWCYWQQSPLSDLPMAIAKTSKKFLHTPVESQIQIAKEEFAIEQINKLYVATTRAEKVLHILTSERPKTNRISQFIYDFCNANGWEFGEAITVPQNPDNKKMYYIFNAGAFFPIQEYRMTLDARPLGDFEPLAVSERERGEAIHLLMERIYTAEDIAEAVSDALSSRLITESDAKNLSDTLNRLLKTEPLADYFQPNARVLIEPEILQNGKSFLKIARPDRLVFLDNKIGIIDYKTGEPHSKHKKQLDLYAKMLTEIYGQQTEKILIYLDKGVTEVWN